MRRAWRTFIVLVALSLGFTVESAAAQEKIGLPANPVVISEVASTPLTAWYVQAEGIFLRRTVGSSAVLATDPGGTTPLGTARDFHFSHDGGPRFVIGKQLSDVNALEFVYFGLYDMQSSASVAGPGMAVGSPIIGTNFNADYHSSVNSFEANLRHSMNGNLSVLAGFRYLNWHEDIDGQFNAGRTIPQPGPLVRSTLLTNNNLWGVQAGGEWQGSLRDLLGLTAFGKAGIFGNEAYARGTTSAGPVTTVVSNAGCQASFIGELGVVATRQINDRLSLRGGYTMMWVEGIALAPDQPARFATNGSIHSNGGVFLHGVVFGAHLRW